MSLNGLADDDGMCKRCHKKLATMGKFCDQCFVLKWEEYKEKYHIK